MYVTTLRIEPRLLAALDKLADRLAAERPGERVTRSDTIRRLLMRGLAAEGVEVATDA